MKYIHFHPRRPVVISHEMESCRLRSRRLGLAAFHRFAIAFNRCRYSPRQSATVFFNRSQTCVTLANDPSSNRLERMCVTILRCQTPVVGPCVWSGSLSFAAARFTVDQIRDFSLFRASGVLFFVWVLTSDA
jgi:hypothetical protein